ncbi:uncharacterized protein LOC123857911 [Mirounga angustirostris]|uniref:uncharacterized protein LOC123857911 n=1 Tax=Mirounga angustirostris TaxID=9716 RepID=UPI00313AB830
MPREAGRRQVRTREGAVGRPDVTGTRRLPAPTRFPPHSSSRRTPLPLRLHPALQCRFKSARLSRAAWPQERPARVHRRAPAVGCARALWLWLILTHTDPLAPRPPCRQEVRLPQRQVTDTSEPRKPAGTLTGWPFQPAARCRPRAGGPHTKHQHHERGPRDPAGLGTGQHHSQLHSGEAQRGTIDTRSTHRRHKGGPGGAQSQGWAHPAQTRPRVVRNKCTGGPGGAHRQAGAALAQRESSAARAVMSQAGIRARVQQRRPRHAQQGLHGTHGKMLSSRCAGSRTIMAFCTTSPGDPESRQVGEDAEELGAPLVSEKMHRRVYKRVPPQVRGQVWILLLDIEKVKSTNQGVYEFCPQKMKEQAQLFSKDIRQIDLDVNRTFRNHVMVRDHYGVRQQALFHVLLAYSVNNPEVGYCQGMSQIVGVLLMLLCEEVAFWALAQLMTTERHVMHGFFIPGLPKLLRFQAHHSLIKAQELPKLKKHLDEEQMCTGIYTAKWFLQCFIDQTPFLLILKLWDAYILDREPWRIPSSRCTAVSEPEGAQNAS